MLLAPIEVAQVETVSVRRGDRVKAGDTSPSGEQRRDDRRRPGRSRARPGRGATRRLRIGKRPEEIAVLEATLQSAKARAGGGRARAGAASRPVEARHRDAGRLRPGRDRAGDAGARRSDRRRPIWPSAKLPARPETIKAAENQVKQAQAALEQARWRLSKRTLAAPSAGRVDDVIRNPGDIAGPSAPVISMLPDGAVKLKVYRARKRASPRSRSAASRRALRRLPART